MYIYIYLFATFDNIFFYTADMKLNIVYSRQLFNLNF